MNDAAITEPKPFHLLTADEWTALVQTKMTWGECAAKYPQPEWCGYPDAVQGAMGCWSLMAHMVTGEDYCKSCDCSKSYIGDAAVAELEAKSERLSKAQSEGSV